MREGGELLNTYRETSWKTMVVAGDGMCVWVSEEEQNSVRWLDDGEAGVLMDSVTRD